MFKTSMQHHHKVQPSNTRPGSARNDDWSCDQPAETESGVLRRSFKNNHQRPDEFSSYLGSFEGLPLGFRDLREAFFTVFSHSGDQIMNQLFENVTDNENNHYLQPWSQHWWITVNISVKAVFFPPYIVEMFLFFPSACDFIWKEKQRHKQHSDDFTGHKLRHWSPTETDWSRLLSDMKRGAEKTFKDDLIRAETFNQIPKYRGVTAAVWDR